MLIGLNYNWNTFFGTDYSFSVVLVVLVIANFGRSGREVFLEKPDFVLFGKEISFLYRKKSKPHFHKIYRFRFFLILYPR